MKVEDSWEDQAYRGQFEAIPNPFRWEDSARFAHLLNAYDMVDFDALGKLANARSAEAETNDMWQGSAVELWMCLFFEHRRWRHLGIDPSPDQHDLLDRLCETLRNLLVDLPPTGRAEVVALLDAHPFPTRLEEPRDG